MPNESKVIEIQEKIVAKFDPDDLAQSNMDAASGLPTAFTPSNFGEMMEFSKLMSVTAAIPAHLRAKPGDCL